MAQMKSLADSIRAHTTKGKMMREEFEAWHIKELAKPAIWNNALDRYAGSNTRKLFLAFKAGRRLGYVQGENDGYLLGLDEPK